MMQEKRSKETKSLQFISVAIPSLFGSTSYPTIPLEPLQREQPLRNIEKSGWRDDFGQRKTHPLLKRMGLRGQSKKSLSGLLPTHHHQHSDDSESEESVGGGFGDGCDG